MNPSEVLALDDLNLSFDLSTAKQNYEANPQNFLVSQDFKNKRRPIKIALKGELTNDKINSQVFNGKPTYSFGIILCEDADVDAFEGFKNFVAKQVPEDWTVKNPADGSVFYIKLAYDSKTAKFRTKCNLPLNSKKLDSLDLYVGQIVTINATLSSWFNLDSSTAGVNLKVSDILFSTE